MTMFNNTLKFFFIFLISFLFTELIEFLVSKYCEINLENLTWGWFGLMIFYGFKYHIICCIVPTIWAGYKCRHKSCEHEYCHDKK